MSSPGRRLLLAAVAVGVVFLIVGWLSTEGVKSQWVRVIDVAILGPACIAIGWYLMRTAKSNVWNVAGIFLVAYGAATISYNARNFMAEQRALKR